MPSVVSSPSTINMPRLMKQVRLACQNMDTRPHLMETITLADILACVCGHLRQEGVVVSFVGVDVKYNSAGAPKRPFYTDFALVVDGKYHTYSDSMTQIQFYEGTSKPGRRSYNGALHTVRLDEDGARKHLGVGFPSEMEQSIGNLVRQELSQMAAEALEAGAATVCAKGKGRRL